MHDMALTDPEDARSAKVAIQSGRPDAGDALGSSGFRARLEGLSLFDLVQMECLARSRRVVRVASTGRVGYLFFQDGEIFHATTKNLVGESAALEMLEWTDGTFEPCNIAWPERGTVKMGWQNLLLGAATSKDEQSAGNLVRLPKRKSQTSADADDLTNDSEELSAADEETTVKPMSERPGPSSSQRSVRIDSNGQVLSSTGDTGDLAGFAAYASRVGELIGQSLGLGRFLALDLGFDASRSILCVEDGGKVVLVDAKRSDDLAEMARNVGL